MSTTLAPPSTDAQDTVTTAIPARLDRLPWSRFHWRIIIGLGTVWILDGLEVTNVSSIASRLTEHGSGIAISVGQIGWAASIYVAGACLGALVFGQLTDRFGRKKLFMITLGIYIISTGLTALSTTWWMFWIFRALTGAGIGGEYASINSAIDELIPARARGRVDLTINGSYWVGSAAAAFLALFFLNTSIFALNVGWRLAFALGVVLGLAVLLVRRNVPESPRWMFIHGHEEEAERLVDSIEGEVEAETGQSLSAPTRTVTVRPRKTVPFRWIARTAFKQYPTRSMLCLALFIGQAFLYNGITFNLGTLMTTFFGVSSSFVPWFIFLFAVSNFAGPLLLGRLFDSIGRKPMISTTYLGSAAVGLVLAILFMQIGLLNSWTFIAIVMVTFFLASTGASAAYLTASEIFPMETRALAIAFFYAVGTAVGGITGPALFGNLIASGSHDEVAIGFFIGAAVMALGGVAELAWGVKAEGASLEDIAAPLTAVEGDQPAGSAGGPAGNGAVTGHRLQGLRARERAIDERARASEHRATAHQLLARSVEGDEAAAARADVEQLLADIADQVALAHDEYVTFHDELASLEDLGDGPAASAARQRAAAAEERAWAHEQDAQALAADGGRDADHHRALAEAALERARAREQRAMAEEARLKAAAPDAEDAEVEQLRSAMHEAWATMHTERSRAHERRAEGDEAGASAAERTATAREEEARAAAFRVEAAERRFEADEQRREDAQTIEASAAHEADQARQDAEARIRARLERRRREQAGLRRYLPGPGRVGYFPGITTPSPLPEEALDNEILSIESALAEHGAVDRRELARLVGARYWGPGAFSEALRQAVADGRAKRVSRSTYAPVDDVAADR